jgi:hypothetical protein
VSRLHGVLRFTQLTTLGLSLASASSAAVPSAADLARCASIADPTARLACYDAINGQYAAGKPTGAAPAAAGVTAAPSTTAAPATTRAPAVAATAESPTLAAAPAPAAASTFSSDPQNFGFTEAQLAPATLKAGPKAIEARVAKIEQSTYGRALAVLDNGQTWVFIDGEQNADLRPQDPITIRRGSLGSFLLITPSHHSYHVRRTQ